jgi:hypothetical protein
LRARRATAREHAVVRPREQRQENKTPGPPL